MCVVAEGGASTKISNNQISVKHSGGKTSSLTVDNWKQRDLDEYTQEELPMELVQHAVVDEIKYFADNVIEIVDTSELKNYADSKLLGGRWVTSNKGDQAQPKVRCRYVATEINHGDTNADLCAATRPLACERLRFSQRAKRHKNAGPDICLMFLGVTKA